MNHRSLCAAVVALILAPPSATPQAAPDGFGFDDLMTTLIQPRHVKLYAAGTQRNWELAAAESRDLRAGLGRIAQRIPRYLNNGVEESIKAMIAPQMDAVDAAIAAGDVRRFATSYEALTQACNACHVYMEHPYIVIQVPGAAAAAAYTDQNFHPLP